MAGGCRVARPRSAAIRRPGPREPPRTGNDAAATTARVFTAAGSRSSALRTTRWHPTNTEKLTGRSGPGHRGGARPVRRRRGSTQRGDLLRQSLTPRGQVQPPDIPAAADVSCQGRSGHPEHEPAPAAVRGHRRSPRKPASALIVDQMRLPACDGHRGRTGVHKSQKALPATLTRDFHGGPPAEQDMREVGLPAVEVCCGTGGFRKLSTAARFPRVLSTDSGSRPYGSAIPAAL